jgi:hypothetical protein
MQNCYQNFLPAKVQQNWIKNPERRHAEEDDDIQSFHTRNSD